MTVKQKQDDILNHIQKSAITSSTSQQVFLQYKFRQDKSRYFYSYFGSQFELTLEINIFDSPLVQVQPKLGMRQADHQLWKLLHAKGKKNWRDITADTETVRTQSLAWLVPNQATQLDHLILILSSHSCLS